MRTALETVLPATQVLTTAEDLAVYAFDGTAILHQQPACVVVPDTVAQIAEVLRLASEHGVPVVTRGSGTGLSGGSVPSEGAIVLCLVRLNRILDVDTANLTMTVEPGVITEAISESAAEAGLFYPPDPGSIRISTIGGNVANNSGGLRGLKYGVTRDYVMALQVALADGRILETGTHCVKDVAGFSLRDLFIGSEGCLGVITRITLKLIPQPAAKATMLGLFDEMTDAAETISAIIRDKIIPCTLEFLDRTTTECVEDYAHIGLPTDVEAVTLMEVDGHAAEVEDQAARIEQIAREHGARDVRRAATTEEATQLASARRTAFSALARRAPTVILEDVTVPRSRLAEMVSAIQRIATDHDVTVGTFGHMGDGNLHPTFLTDERNTDEMERVEAALKEVFQETIDMGGTITGEHGVGLAKKPFLPAAVGSVAMDLMQRLKKDFDPVGILNPGKIFD
ncbi:MAG TPA: FAD-linked oxidase C-terminal domain-containing protein [Candidatus Latescibacteria bacterium]|nr:FAD-linked oxidase C-terminal domain-containing protein [Candidatus Latescibacterota bacterium]HJP32310.1 FAD-linked oxidase C-terminal domain-containing protein [Candidatus Latescibacterota bacterium]